MTGAMDRLSLNSATVKHLDLRDAVDLCARHGIRGIGLWRDQVQACGAATAAAMVGDAGLTVSSLCRGGFFTVESGERERMLDDNRAAIEEAATVGAESLVLVSGGLVPGSQDLALARDLVGEALAELAPEALAAGVRLAIEPLHPMFCADRCVISQLGAALDLALEFPAAAVGVVVDTYHVWWDHEVLSAIGRAGDRIAVYQVCDWILPLPADVLLGRGHVGDGHIDFTSLTAAVVAAGYEGMIEVEIFNQTVWDSNADDTAAVVKQRFASHMADHLAHARPVVGPAG